MLKNGFYIIRRPLFSHLKTVRAAKRISVNKIL